LQNNTFLTSYQKWTKSWNSAPGLSLNQCSGGIVLDSQR